MIYEPLIPVGYHTFEIPTDNLPMEEMMEWLLDNKGATTPLSLIHI